MSRFEVLVGARFVYLLGCKGIDNKAKIFGRSYCTGDRSTSGYRGSRSLDLSIISSSYCMAIFACMARDMYCRLRSRLHVSETGTG